MNKRFIPQCTPDKTLAEIEEEMKIVNPLISYYYFHRREQLDRIMAKFPNKYVNLMVDSGVFTGRKEGVELCIDTYIDYLNSNADIIKYAITMDFPNDQKSIIANTEYIQERLDERITLVPVIQSFAFDEHGIDYVLKNWDFICIGTYDGKNESIMYNAEVQKTLMPIYRANKKYNKFLHGLGRTKPAWLYRNPIQSTDSSSWARNIYSGTTSAFDSKTKEIVTPSKTTRHKIFLYEDRYVKKFGLDKELFEYVLTHPETLHGETRIHTDLCCLGYLELQEEVRKNNPNYRFHYATTNPYNFDVLNRCADMYYNRDKNFVDDYANS